CPKIITPVPTHEYNQGRQGSMENKGLQGHIIQLGKVDFLHAGILKPCKQSMVNDYDGNQGDLKLPIVVCYKGKRSYKYKEVHFEHAMHLINELRYKQGTDTATYVLI